MRQVLLIAPGATVASHQNEIITYINDKKPLIIGVNFVPEDFACDYVFFSNSKRFSKLDNIGCKVIATSNLPKEKSDFQINYNSLSGAFEQGCNSLLMLLTLLKQMEVAKVSIAGADGYSIGGTNYFRSDLRTYSEHGHNFNVAVAKAIRNMGLNVSFITPSAYDTSEE